MFSANLEKLTDSAEFYFEKSKYSEAIRFYNEIIKEGKTSWKLHYNLGNAYFKNNQLGSAIYHYELANKLSPNNSDIKTNLSLANTKLIDKIESKDNFFFANIKGSILGLFSINGWAWLSITISTLMSISFTLFYFSKKPSARRFLFWTGILLFTFLIGSMMFGFSSLNIEKKENNGIILSKVCKVINSPNSNSVSFSLHEGTKVAILEKNGEWVAIQLSNGNEGWVKRNELGLF